MNDVQLGAALLMLRIRQGLTQAELGVAAGVPRSVVGRVERGRLERCNLRSIRAIAAALDCEIVLTARWRGGDLGRLQNARHSAMHEALGGRFASLQEWVIEPEVSFSVYGERGVIDALAWHAATGSLLVIELKTEFVDINELMGRSIASGGWPPGSGGIEVGVSSGCRPGSPSQMGGRTAGRSRATS